MNVTANTIVNALENSSRTKCTALRTAKFKESRKSDFRYLLARMALMLGELFESTFLTHTDKNLIKFKFKIKTIKIFNWNVNYV